MFGQEKDTINSSPYDFSFKKEVPFIATSITALIGSVLIKNNNDSQPFTDYELTQLDRNDVNSFDRSATYNYNPNAAEASDVLKFGVVIFPALFLVNKHTRKDIKGLALLTVEVVSINWGITNSTKYLVNRTRPYVYNETTPTSVKKDNQSRLSFFSGHVSHTAAVSFLFAKVMTDYNPDMSTKYKVGLWSVAALVPATTAYLRVRSGKHFPTDVMFGYGIGATIGWLIPHLHKIKSPIRLSSYSFQDANGVSVSYLF